MKKKLLPILMAGIMVLGSTCSALAEEQMEDFVTTGVSGEYSEDEEFPEMADEEFPEDFPEEIGGLLEESEELIEEGSEFILSEETTEDEPEDLLIPADQIHEDELAPAEDEEEEAAAEESDDLLSGDEVSSEVPEIVGGSTMETAINISLGTNISGSIDQRNPNSYYKMTLPSSGRITINAVSYVKYNYYYFYDINGTQLKYWYVSQNSQTGQSNGTYTLDLTKGTYYFAVVNNGNTWGNFNFSVNFESAGESFAESGNGNNNSMEAAKAISAGKTYVGQIAENDDKDFYKLTLSSSGRVTITASAFMTYIYYTLYDKNGNRIIYWEPYWDTNTGKSVIVKSLDLTSGTYYLGVTKVSSYTGKYNFNITYKDAGESFKEPQGGSNNSMENANPISIGKTYKGQLAINDSKDFYKFTLSEAKVITISTTSNVNSYIYFNIYNNVGTSLWQQSVYGGDGSEKKVLSDEISLSKGTYYFATTVNYSDHSGKYTFKLSQKSFPGTVIYKMEDVGSGCLRIYWRSQGDQVTGYQIQWSTDSSFRTGAKSASLTGVNNTVRSDLIVGSTYYVRARTYVIYNNARMYSGWSSTRSLTLTRTLPTPGIRSAINTSGKIKTSWYRVSGVEGYQLRFAKNPEFKEATTASVAGAYKTTLSRSYFSRYYNWYVSVRSYKTASDGVRYYSRWSDGVRVS